ncbi:MAG: hypothetical protein I8H88_06345 [Burkholderiales bacterium]|nr:hypothetical protein [Burkholderiales bacterium]
MSHPASSFAAALLAALLSSQAVQAQSAIDWSLSGFGTVGHAISDQPWRYERVIDHGGTLWRDSLFGAQLDARITPAWSATLQLTLAPSTRHDRQWSTEAAWAFVSWRPNNEWSLRLGKQRVPIFLNSENRDVGQTHAFARLPTEIYALSPTVDFTGASVARTWLHGSGELVADVYAGRAQVANRMHSRDVGVGFVNVDTDLFGAALTWRQEDLTVRGGLVRARSARSDGLALPTDYPRVQVAPGLGYFQVDNALPGPGVPSTDHITNEVVYLGADWQFAAGWWLVAEAARNFQRRTQLGFDSAGASLALLHTIGDFTPYVSAGRQQSLGASRLRSRRLLESAGAGTDELSVAQRRAGEAIRVQDQTSVGVGLGWAVTPQSRLKAEWMHTRIGERSALVDNPPGETLSGRSLNVLSLNYSFAF